MTISWMTRLSEGRIVPYFQPIVSVESQRVEAFEALGRHEVGPEVRSLGPFFEAPEGDQAFEEYRRGIDRTLRYLALSRFAAEAAPDQRLFLNVNPRWMVDHLRNHPGEVPWTMKAIETTGVDPHRIVIELTEEAVGSHTSSLRKLVEQYRASGCQIAVDDVGAEASNLDRIGEFEPDIIKIDGKILRRSLGERAFTEVLTGLRSIADGLGASLLFEGVESEEELDQALRCGARYLQGWYFSKAEPDFLSPDHHRQRLLPRLRTFGNSRSEGMVLQDRSIGRTIGVLSSSRPQLAFLEDRVTIDPASLEPWTGLACRVFLTDRQGFQVSGNYESGDGEWKARAWGLGSCRAARPYFSLRGAPNRGGSRLWSVSEPYFDVNDRTRIRTFGQALGADLILFVDVPEVENRPLNR